MNKSQKKFVRAVKAACERGFVSSTRVGYLPTITHGAITPPRNNAVGVVSGSRVNLDDYEDAE